MRIAIPVMNGQLTPHFGHCTEFALIDVNLESKTIENETSVPAPPHQPGLLPPWLSEQGVSLIIAGGMGGRAQQIFTAHNVQVITGAPSLAPRDVAQAFLEDKLALGPNACDSETHNGAHDCNNHNSR